MKRWRRSLPKDLGETRRMCGNTGNWHLLISLDSTYRSHCLSCIARTSSWRESTSVHTHAARHQPFTQQTCRSHSRPRPPNFRRLLLDLETLRTSSARANQAKVIYPGDPANAAMRPLQICIEEPLVQLRCDSLLQQRVKPCSALGTFLRKERDAPLVAPFHAYQNNPQFFGSAVRLVRKLGFGLVPCKNCNRSTGCCNLPFPEKTAPDSRPTIDSHPCGLDHACHDNSIRRLHCLTLIITASHKTTNFLVVMGNFVWKSSSVDHGIQLQCIPYMVTSVVIGMLRAMHNAVREIRSTMLQRTRFERLSTSFRRACYCSRHLFAKERSFRQRQVRQVDALANQWNDTRVCLRFAQVSTGTCYKKFLSVASHCVWVLDRRSTDCIFCGTVGPGNALPRSGIPTAPGTLRCTRVFEGRFGAVGSSARPQWLRSISG